MKTYYSGDEDDIFFYDSIEDYIKNTCIRPYECYDHSLLYKIEDKSEVDLKPYIIKKDLTKEEINKIEEKIDKLIITQEERDKRIQDIIKLGKPVSCCSGFLIIYHKGNRQKYIDQYIKEESYKWKNKEIRLLQIQ